MALQHGITPDHDAEWQGSKPGKGPLRVVDYGCDIQAQYAAKLLGELGAKVVRIESRADRVGTSKLPPFANDLDGRPVSVTREFLNMGKSVILLDASTANGRRDLQALNASADIFLTNGPCWNAIRRFNKAAVTVVTTPYGVDLDVDAVDLPSTPFTRYLAGGDGNFLPSSTAEGLRPTCPPGLSGEFMVGIGVAVSALAGLLARGDKTSEGVTIDFSHQAYSVLLNKMFLSRVSYDGVDLTRSNHAYPYGGNIRCSDGFVAMLLLEDHQWEGLCRMLDADDWSADENLATGSGRLNAAEAIADRIGSWCQVRSVDDVISLAERFGVPAGRLREPRDVVGDGGMRRRGFMRRRPTAFGTLWVPGLPFSIGKPLGSTVSDGRVPHADGAVEPRGTQVDPAPSGPDACAISERDGLCSRSQAQGGHHMKKDVLTLSGIRVLDFTWVGAGPMATSLLALMGADVVKVEHSSRPDIMRLAGRKYGWDSEASIDASPSFTEIAAEKRSIGIDLRLPEGRQLAARLAASADVVCENMRPGKMERLGLGYSALREANPLLIFCSLSGTGRIPGSSEAKSGYAPIFWAEGGAALLTGWPEGDPCYLRAPVDMNAGATACLGILAALQGLRRSGTGSYVDCSATESVASLIGDLLLSDQLGVGTPERSGNDRPPAVPNDAFPCMGADEWIAISVESGTQWESLCAALGAERLIGEHSLLDWDERWLKRADIYDELAAHTRRWSAMPLERRLIAAGVPAARVMSLRDLVFDGRLRARGFWRTVTHPHLHPQEIAGLAWRSKPPFPVPEHGGPLLGADTDEILKSWGRVGADEVERLRMEGVVE